MSPKVRKGLLWLLFSAFTSVIVWGAYNFANPTIRTELVAFTIDSDRQVTIRFNINRRDPSMVLTCRLIARDFDTEIVGDRFVEILADSRKSLQITELIPTRSKAVTSSVARCLPKQR